MKIIGVIPARYRSSRFPGKPLADICGKPMIWWVYQQARKVLSFADVVVATDDDRIKTVCENLKMEVVMTSSKHPTGTDRMAEVAQKIEGDLYVNIQGDEPLIEPKAIESVIDYFRHHDGVDVINTMTKIDDEEVLNQSSTVKVAFNERNEVIYLSRSVVPFKKGNVDVGYYRHMGLYAIKREALFFFARTPRGRIEQAEDIEMFRFLENGIRVGIIPVMTNAIAVDRPCDIIKVEAAIKEKQQAEGERQ